MKVYHYTSKECLNNIIKTNTLIGSSDTSTDASLGNGIYFTDLPPETPNVDLCMILWGKNNISKIETYIEIKIDQSLLKKSNRRPHIYNLPLDYINFNDLIVNGIEDAKYGIRKMIEEIQESSDSPIFKGLVIAGVAIGLGALLYNIFKDQNKK